MRKSCIAAALAATLVSPMLHAQPAGGGPGKGGPQFGAGNTPGWAMMSAEERTAHREKMLAFKDAPSCEAYMAEHHKAMSERAKAQGKTLPAPAGRGCEHLKKKS